MKVEFLGHSGFVVEHAGARVACDPWLSPRGAYHASWFQLPQNHHLFARSYDDLAAVVLSHEHYDHLDVDFLRQRLTPATPIVVPRYPSRNLVDKLTRITKNPVIEVDSGAEHVLTPGGLKVLFTSEESPANQDSCITFFDDEHVLVNLNDARLTPKQRGQLQRRFGTIDAVMLQCAGASWFPMRYRYSEERTRELSREKRKAKLEYAFHTLEHLAPRIGLPYAGPCAFLDQALQRHNDELGEDNIFPDQAESAAWLRARGYGERLELPLPGDRLDLATGAFEADREIRRTFSWEDKAGYIRAYADRVQATIAAEIASLERPATSLFPAFKAYFERLGDLNAYFRSRIDMELRFVIDGPHGGDWLVRCHADGVEVSDTAGRRADYTLWLEDLWLHQILSHHLAWEDFFLSLRFEAERDPDVYNDHLLSWLKFADEDALRAVERYESSRRENQRIEVEANGHRYLISKYCPHAGASMEKAVIEGTTITCLNHHYRFDLETGKCLNGNCTLFTKRLD
ncbi:MAG: MBL fold metallo-hydrolase [Labilithrix sp.]|nr:MBL fold metallo-hydrolase [Labilithrix sp.]MCW5814722.1 MBL fold metallo-hydrolase [Labilithrix sp.]